MRSRGRLFLAGLFVTLISAPAVAGDALDKPAFTATAEELLAAAKAAPAGDFPAVILRSDDTRTVDDDGKVVSRWRWVFVVKSQAGVDNWGTLQSTYRPFYQDKPVFRLRVIAPDGTVTELDQSLITEAPEVETSPTVFSDNRVIQAPLPRLQIGSVVEEEMTTTDREPLLAAGSVELVTIGSTVPVLSTRIAMSAPLKRKAIHVARKLPTGAKLDHTKTKTRESWAYAIGKLDAHPDLEWYAPADAPQRPYVGLATAPTWAAVAADYRKVIDKRIADGPVTLPSGLPTTATLETVYKIVAWLHTNVRYTGIEFGEASHVPWPPAETVKRGFGDCKDKATLLVALLAQAGITADLALVSTGPGLDVDADLPGMGVFDHAIVRARVGKTDVWIDATQDLVRPGQLPDFDQGRRALVISDATKGLVKTPASVAKDNVVREVRTFELSEIDSVGARVTEVSTEGGVFEPGSRAWIRDERADEVKKGLTSYAKDEYLAVLDKYATTDPVALDAPFAITTSMTTSKRADTARSRIDIYVFPVDALEKVPSTITSDAPEARKHDFVWSRPHVYEIENRLKVPPGYTMPSPPAARVRKLGSATLEESYRVDGRTLVVTYRFDSGKVRLTPKEVTALREALAPVRQEQNHIVVEHTAWALSDRGKPREAFTEMQALIKLHPTEAVHQTQLAHVLLRARMGDAARRAARKAVELEPKNADAHAVLGWVLRHDTIGREWGFDFDRAGSIAAFKKARALDPKHYGAAADFGLVLEHGTNGRRWDTGADLKGAAAQYRAALAIFDADDDDAEAARLAKVLIAAGDYAESEKVARARPASIDRDAVIIAAVAARAGGAEGIAEARRLRTGAERTKVIDLGAAMLYSIRRYDDMRVLYAETQSMAPGTPEGILTARLVKHDKIAKPGKGPESAVENMLAIIVDPSQKPKIFLDARSERDLRKSLEGAGPAISLVDNPELPLQIWIDATLSNVKLKSEGGAKGPWRVEVEASGQRYRFYVALDHGVAKLAGSSTSPAGAGRLVRRFLDEGNPKAAEIVLDWVSTDVPRHMFTDLWGPGLPRDEDAMALAGAVLDGDGDGARGIDLLTDCASTVTGAREVCDNALAWAQLELRRWQELLDHVTAWQKRTSRTSMVAFLRGAALVELGRLDDADKDADAILGKDPGDASAVHVKVEVALARGQIADAVQRSAARTTRPDAGAMELNNAAWLRLAEGSDLTTALELAQRSIRVKDDHSTTFNTLAAIQAEQGELTSAAASLLRSMELGRRRALEGQDHYVVGRIAEQLGLRDDAIAAYKKVKKPAEPSRMPTAADLASKRLDAMGVKH